MATVRATCQQLRLGSHLQRQRNWRINSFLGNINTHTSLRVQLLCPTAIKEDKINVHTLLPPGRNSKAEGNVE